MAPLAVAALIAAGLFGLGTVVKPTDPQVGTVLQVAGVGTLVGGAVGAAAGAGSALATGLGTATTATTIGTTAAIGGAAGAATGVVLAPAKPAKR